MAIQTRASNLQVWLVAMGTFVVLLFVAWGVIGESAPFWKTVVTAVAAGLVAGATGRLFAYLRR
ncbi:hypothetical protein [uncultured Jatrophihabitans sp.]|uniref:hypothetical protein n=1 Tax=uncultured Jatrophihabitans sp. TaxID=1610747 RepID=UPI0035C9A4B2